MVSGEEPPDSDAVREQSLARMFEARSQARHRARSRRRMLVTFAVGAAVGAGGATMVAMLASALRSPVIATTASARASIAPQPVGARNRAESPEPAASPLTTPLPRRNEPTPSDGGLVGGGGVAPSAPVATVDHAARGGGGSSRTELPPARRGQATASEASAPSPTLMSQAGTVTPTERVRPSTALKPRPGPSLAPRRPTPAPKRRTTPSMVTASPTAATSPTDVRRPTPEHVASPIVGSTASTRAHGDLERKSAHPSPAAPPPSTIPSASSEPTPGSPTSYMATVLRPLLPVRVWSRIKPKFEKLPWRERDPATEPESVQQR
jgi:hypothetical protein